MTKQEAIAHVGSVAELAARLGITTNAIYMWDEQRPIPERHALKLKYEIPATPRAHALQQKAP